MTVIEKVKAMRNLGYSETFISEKSGINYTTLYRTQRGGKGLSCAQGQRIHKLYKAVIRLERMIERIKDES